MWSCTSSSCLSNPDPLSCVQLNCSAEWQAALGASDLDSDGSTYPGDCNEMDASIYPGAAEICGDNLDNNCNGQTDEGCGSTDADRDGWSPPNDCDDSDSDVYPGQTQYFSSPRADGESYDYNCSGVEEKQLTEIWSFSGSDCLSGTVEGWYSSVPSCGAIGEWGIGCNPDVPSEPLETILTEQFCR